MKLTKYINVFICVTQICHFYKIILNSENDKFNEIYIFIEMETFLININFLLILKYYKIQKLKKLHYF